MPEFVVLLEDQLDTAEWHLVIERPVADDRKERAEDLLLHDGRVGRDVVENRRRDLSLVERAAGDDLRAASDGAVEETLHARGVAVVDQPSCLRMNRVAKLG